MLEQIYNDFVERVLPKLGEGLTLTKDYFFDLFGRYVKFLIFWDSVGVGVGILLLILFGIFLKKFISWAKKERVEESRKEAGVSVLIVLLLVILAAGLMFFFTSINNLAQDIFVPEIRIYQKLLPLIKK